jgi:hypothetical protein
LIRFARATTATLLALATVALGGCAAAEPASPPPASSDNSSACEQVTVIVDYGPLDEPALTACSEAGIASDVLADAGVTTAGTVDYGDQVVCRVNDLPSPDAEVTIDGEQPFVETCQTLSAIAYWALWVRSSADAEWEYAQDGVTALDLADGQSVGLVYTPAAESTPPQG